MDPQEIIREQLEIANRLLHLPEQDGHTEALLDDAQRLAALVVTMDDYRRGGGPDPYA